MFISKEDKKELLCHIVLANEILNKYPYNTTSVVTIMDRTKTYIEKALQYINDLCVEPKKLLPDCSTALRKNCSLDCESCICNKCEKRNTCDGGNPLTGCNE